MYYTIESGEGVICEKLFEYVELFWLYVVFFFHLVFLLN